MREGYEDLTVHGVVDLHIARANEQGAMTIKDHLILDEVNDLPLLVSLYRKIYDGLKLGNSFHEQLGSVYLLNERRGGRQPEGFGDDPPKGHDKLKFNTGRSLVATAMNGVAEGDYRFNGTTPAIQRTTQVAATIPSKRKQQDIVAAPLALEQELAFARQENDFLQRENEMLRGGRVGVTNSLEAPRRGRPPLAAAGNGNTPQN